MAPESNAGCVQLEAIDVQTRSPLGRLLGWIAALTVALAAAQRPRSTA